MSLYPAVSEIKEMIDMLGEPKMRSELEVIGGDAGAKEVCQRS
jgi:hypothetical protein